MQEKNMHLEAYYSSARLEEMSFILSPLVPQQAPALTDPSLNFNRDHLKNFSKSGLEEMFQGRI
jgi:hypothetical protein